MPSPIRLFLLICALGMGVPAFAGDGHPTNAITVSGEGRVAAVPDQATVMTGVETRADSPAAALEANSLAANALFEVLKKHGVEPRDIQTSGFNLSPEYRHLPDSGEMQLLGYTVNNQLGILVRDLDRLGVLLDALVQAGSNRMSGIEFSHSGIQALTDTARRAAIVDARRRAELYAEAAGVRLGAVLSIAEQGADFPQPMFRAVAMDEMGGVPVAAGEQQIQANVQVSYALEQD